MRNYVQVIVAEILSIVGDVPSAYLWVPTIEAGNDFIALEIPANFDPADFYGKQFTYFVELNKHNLLSILNQGGSIDPTIFKTESPKNAWKSGAAGFVTENRVDGGVPAISKPTISKSKASTISGIWIVVRNNLYFAGFSASNGDPIFVKFLFGTVSAHLYLTKAQADKDAAVLTKIFKRPDIPIIVIEI